ncbi:MAG: hypothetical protein KAJ49_04490 [Arcobacteraceae bacterium]|nr:hypothetical protein [Arcobacteraceae bacterium]
MKSKEDVKGLVALEKLRHKNRMIEIKTEKEAKMTSEKLRFDNQMQLQRIKTAEIKRVIDRKANREYMERSRYRGG